MKKFLQLSLMLASVLLGAYAPAGKILSIDPNHINIPGKMYVSGNLLFVNDLYTGVHIFDISDPTQPLRKDFITISNNVDIAVWSNALYADSDGNILIYDISNASDPVLVKVLSNVVSFPYNALSSLPVDTNNYYGYNGPSCSCTPYDLPTEEGVSPVYSDGGLLDRFSVVNGILYTFKNGDIIKAYGLSDPTNPQPASSANIPLRNVESVYPYQNKLFIGTADGMMIYGVSNPSNPVYLAQHSQIHALDPFVISSNIAYFVLRNVSDWPKNRLEVVDMSVLTNFRTLFKIPMYGPQGLGTLGDYLYIADGYEGLKRFGISNLNAGNLSNGLISYPKAAADYASGVLPATSFIVVEGSSVQIYSVTNQGVPELMSTIY